MEINDMETRLYKLQDMVKVDCMDCKGCSACCRGMGDTIILDPYDIYRLSMGLGQNFDSLLSDGRASLHVQDGLVLPSLSMSQEGNCTFLNAEGRCGIHKSRPGLCRIYPLGRQYVEDEVYYFLLDTCPKKEKVKTKVEKWIDTKNLPRYTAFLSDWHKLQKECKMRSATFLAEEGGEEKAGIISTTLLKVFYFLPYDAEQDFYTQYEERCVYMKEFLA